MHTTMQTLGRFAIIGGTVLVAVANIIIFSNTEGLNETEKVSLYGSVYLWALVIPFVSVLGVFLLLSKIIKRVEVEETKINWWILGGSFVFVVFTISIGSFRVPFAQEIVFLGSMGIVLFLMMKLIKELPNDLRFTIVGTAIIVFVFRAMPGPGPDFRLKRCIKI